MSYDLAPLKSYVRFYLAILSQLERVWQSLCAIETAVREELGPFAADLAPVGLPALATLTDPPRTLPAELAALWRPEDPDELDGLCDIYEVVGRFSFQGERDANLAAATALVATARGAIVENDEALRGLEPLGARARATSEALAAAEKARAAADRSDRAARLEPMIEAVLLRAKQTQDALHAVPIPTLADAATAGEEYRRLRARLQQVYQTCLPFLKNAIAAVWAFVDAPVPQDFPEDLPLVPELPPELVALPEAGSEDLDKAEKTLASLALEAQGLEQTKAAIASELGKLEAQAAAILARRDEHRADIELARALLDWARATEVQATLQRKANELERELAPRVALASKATTEVADLKTELEADTKEAEEKAVAIAALEAELAELQKKEPLLFGKDEWRGKVAAAQSNLEAERLAHTALGQSVAQRRMELTAAEVRVGTAQAEQAITERSLADVRTRRVEVDRELRALAEKLGSKRPARPVPPSEVEEIAVALEHKELGVAAELERVRAEQQRKKEDALRTIARGRQIEVERQHAQARVDGVRVARAEGIDAAHRRLAADRRAAVEEHVREVLGALSKSLVQVGPVFVDPARERLRVATEPDFGAAERVAAAAAAVAPVVERLLAERGPEIVAVGELLGRIQREFCDAAPAACRAAWG
ncbi:MAG: hypothetical protein HY908_07820 [Myxococcales bacterium]|nr:hypothetical protein [Myxococcales bacterium]